MLAKDVYRCLSAVQPHQHAIQDHLVQHGRDLFHFANDLLLYDLTSTYFEGRLAGNYRSLGREKQRLGSATVLG